MCKKIIIFAFIFILCFGICAFEKSQVNNILDGIYIDKIYVGGLNKKEALSKVHDSVKKNINRELVLTYGKNRWNLKYSQILDLDIDKTVDKALKYGRGGFILNTFFTRVKLKYSPKIVPLSCDINEQNFTKLLRNIRNKIDEKPRDAFFYLDNNNEINIAKEKKGVKVDDMKLRSTIKDSFFKNKSKTKIPVKILDIKMDTNFLKNLKIKHKLIEFSTFFNNANKNRTENLKLAAKKINGYILTPGEIFSFNKVVGKRSKENGYKKAPVFINGKTAYDIGGGVCQVSSTMYNAALLLDLEIVERRNHSRPVGYVPLGLDATVEYDLIDLKFRNNTNGTLVIFTMVRNDELKVIIYGSKKINKNISLSSEIMDVIPPLVTIEEDRNQKKDSIRINKGKQGYKVRVWKYYNNHDKKIVSIDIYTPIDTIIFVGKK